jgi:hypothetical protein
MKSRHHNGIAYVTGLIMILMLATAANDLAAGDITPLPRPRPAAAAMMQLENPQERTQSPCRLRLTSDIALAPSLPGLHGPGECGADDVVRLEAILLPNKRRVTLNPPAILRCGLAETVVKWVREDVAPVARSLIAPIQSIENYASYDCRARNGVLGATVSEHGKANALDIRAVKLADGTVLWLTDSRVSKEFRENLRERACARFMTVLGPRSDGYHEDHIHLDLAERKSGLRICHWEVLEPDGADTPGAAYVPLPQSR